MFVQAKHSDNLCSKIRLCLEQLRCTCCAFAHHHHDTNQAIASTPSAPRPSAVPSLTKVHAEVVHTRDKLVQTRAKTMCVATVHMCLQRISLNKNVCLSY
jgi:hypothetical protein